MKMERITGIMQTRDTNGNSDFYILGENKKRVASLRPQGGQFMTHVAPKGKRLEDEGVDCAAQFHDERASAEDRIYDDLLKNGHRGQQAKQENE